MGLLKHLLFWPVTAPLALTRFSLGQAGLAAQRELADDAPIKEELLELQLKLELGEIDEDEYAEREAEALERLREAREWQEHLGLAAPWGPVRVARDDEEGEEGREGEAGPPRL